MDEQNSKAAPPVEGSTPAERALAEAADRRALAYGDKDRQETEINGRKGPEPVRYGDWENKGIASDF